MTMWLNHHHVPRDRAADMTAAVTEIDRGLNAGRIADIRRERVGNATLERLDVHAWNGAIDVESAERESLKDVLSQWSGTISESASKCLTREEPR